MCLLNIQKLISCLIILQVDELPVKTALLKVFICRKISSFSVVQLSRLLATTCLILSSSVLTKRSNERASCRVNRWFSNILLQKKENRLTISLIRRQRTNTNSCQSVAIVLTRKPAKYFSLGHILKYSLLLLFSITNRVKHLTYLSGNIKQRSISSSFVFTSNLIYVQMQTNVNKTDKANVLWFFFKSSDMDLCMYSKSS